VKFAKVALKSIFSQTLRRLAGADHLLFETDYPFTLGDWVGVEKITAMECSATEKDAILQGNARRLLRI
jgi:predicted TIM-barrel fold metal-dependent hydrolase